MTREEAAPFVAWLRFCVEAERYDRAICRNRDRRTGEAIPITPEERSATDTHARILRERLHLDRPLDEVARRARAWVESLSFEEQERALAALERTA